MRFGTGEAANGWDELCRLAVANSRRCLEILRSEPRSRANHQRQHRLRGDLATRRHNGQDLEQWEYEVTSGGRVRYLIDDETEPVKLVETVQAAGWAWLFSWFLSLGGSFIQA
ncbi:hypothetical protein, partial [Actinomadura bangladeshensis]|uniref:hypothetical protein n=1 Tax=Actinomadura bangladeshensis TaxID=453573 RepID=UPI0031D2896B